MQPEREHSASREVQEHVTRLVSRGESLSLANAVQEVVNSARALFGVDGSGVMLADDAHILRYIAASDGHGRELEHVQERVGTGPCVEALIDDHVITTEDVTTDPRWTALHAELRETRVRAVLGVPIRISGAAVGSIDAYRASPGSWRSEEIDGMLAYASVVERLLLTAMRAHRHERTVQQLEHALEHRITIERAVGILMEREHLDAVAAFERLRTTARSSRRRVAEIAAEIVSGDPL